MSVSSKKNSRARSCNDHNDYYSQTANKDEDYKSLVDFFEDLQYHLQRVCDFFTLIEFSSDTAKIKGLLLKAMAEALTSVVNYIKTIRERPTSKSIC
jgi:hypothetical protein